MMSAKFLMSSLSRHVARNVRHVSTCPLVHKWWPRIRCTWYRPRQGRVQQQGDDEWQARVGGVHCSMVQALQKSPSETRGRHLKIRDWCGPGQGGPRKDTTSKRGRYRCKMSTWPLWHSSSLDRVRNPGRFHVGSDQESWSDFMTRTQLHP